MTQRQSPRIRQLIQQCSQEVILSAAERCDGHSIVSPDAFTDAGLPAEVVEALATTYKSDGTPKGTIFVNGQPVKELKGVYGLRVLQMLADALGVKYASAFGRGKEARNIQLALRQHFQPQENTAPSSGARQQ